MARATKVLTEEEKDKLEELGGICLDAMETFYIWLQPRRPFVAGAIGLAVRWVKGLLEREVA